MRFAKCKRASPYSPFRSIGTISFPRAAHFSSVRIDSSPKPVAIRYWWSSFERRIRTPRLVSLSPMPQRLNNCVAKSLMDVPSSVSTVTIASCAHFSRSSFSASASSLACDCALIIPAKSFTYPRGLYWSSGLDLVSWGGLADCGADRRIAGVHTHSKPHNSRNTRTLERRNVTRRELYQRWPTARFPALHSLRKMPSAVEHPQPREHHFFYCVHRGGQNLVWHHFFWMLGQALFQAVSPRDA
jgi:hypothetical protein